MQTKHPTTGNNCWLYDTIQGVETQPQYPQIRWTCSYQGECDYVTRDGRKLQFRHSKYPWEPGKWNYASQQDFENQHNGSWGILHCANEPVDAETLDTFRRENFPSAVTGYFNHHINSWTECDPTREQLSRKSYIESGAKARFIADNPQLNLTPSSLAA